jgi:hypothetical protein
MKNLKIAISVLALTFTASSFAQAVRECSTQTLSCRLEKQLPTGGRSLITSSVTEFDGTNSDEPSIPPSECTIRTSLEDNTGVVFNVSLGDSDNVANIYLLKRPNLGSILTGDTAFTVTVGTPFYYRYADTTLICTLSK